MWKTNVGYCGTVNGERPRYQVTAEVQDLGQEAASHLHYIVHCGQPLHFPAQRNCPIGHGSIRVLLSYFALLTPIITGH